jgi:hypothetical protein
MHCSCQILFAVVYAVNIEGLQTSFLHFIYTSKGNVSLHLKSQEIVLEKCNLQCLASQRAKDRKGMMILCLALELCYHEILSENIVLMGGIVTPGFMDKTRHTLYMK